MESKNINKNYNLFFGNNEEKSQKLADEFFEALSSNNFENFEKVIEENGIRNIFVHERMILERIRELTSNISLEEKEKYIEELKNTRDIIKVNINESIRDNEFNFVRIMRSDFSDKLSTIKTEDREIKFLPISCDFWGNRNKREGICHQVSIEAGNVLYKNGFDCNLINGYVHLPVDKVSIQHTFIELNLNGEKWVMDCTENLVMDKEGYEYLHQFEEKVIIPGAELEDDLKTMEKLAYKNNETMYSFDYPTYFAARRNKKRNE